MLQGALVVHVAAGAVALLTGFAALAVTKGGLAHRRVGRVFLWAMLTMGLSGAGIAAVTGVGGSVIGGLLAAYLVTSGVASVLAPAPWLRRVTIAMLFVAFPLGLLLVALGVSTLAGGSLVRNGAPVPVILLFGGVALLAASGDYRRIRSGPAPGRSRLAAHAWRMCFGLFIASGSFFLGQADEIPEALRIWPVLWVLALLPLLVMPYWLWRVRRGRVGAPAATPRVRPLARGAAVPVVALMAAAFASCGPDEGGEASPAGEPAPAVSPEARDSAAVAALVASDKWGSPSCRWLEKGAHVVAYAQETALLREAATCPPSSRPEVWGVPVSRRELISATFLEDYVHNPAMKIYSVEYRWVPTRVGQRVKRDLTGTMAVQDGHFRTRVYLLADDRVIDPSGWYVDQIDDLGAERVR